MHTDPRGETPASLRWEKVMYWPLTAAALVFIVLYTVQVVGDIHGMARLITSALVFASWVLFIADYLARLLLSRPRGRWFRTHLADLAIAVVPVLRPVRLLGALTRIASFTRTSASSLRSSLLIYGIAAALLLIWTCSLMVLDVERHTPGANITTFGDALWWAFCTVTTVGYGDYTPVTATGRVVAVFLMMGGVVLVGLIVATFSSWVLERADRGHEDRIPVTVADLRRLERELGVAHADGPADAETDAGESRVVRRPHPRAHD